MKRTEEVYRELLYESMENNNRILTQSGLSKKLKISLSVINLALKPLRKMNAVKVNQRSMSIIDRRKILFYWASIRNPEKDVIYATRVDGPVRKIESEMPPSIIFGAYSAYRRKYRDAPSDYSEVYIYADDITELRKRFPIKKGNENLIALKKDSNMKMTAAQLFVDLWNLKEWYAKEYLDALEEKLNGLLE